jgi:Transglutaminase-like superfamily
MRYRNLSLLLALVIGLGTASRASAEVDSEVQTHIDKGSFAEAEKLLRVQIPDPTAPPAGDAAIQLEIIRRTRHDFALTDTDVLAQIKKTVPDATQADVDRWREAGDLQYRMIDGERRYFGRSVSNLFRFNADAKKRQTESPEEKKFNTTALVENLVKLSESADDPKVYPVKQHVTYEVAVHKGHPRLKPGSVVRAWLPFPQEYRQQRDVKLIKSDPPGAVIADKDAPHRSLYFEQTVDDATKPPRFRAEFEFVTSAYCPKLDAAKVQPYDVNSAVYREFTAERPPHIVFTPDVTALAREIVGDETNPLEKARRVFRWVSDNIPWCAEMEYGIIPNLSKKGLTARRGDCGVQGMTFITLCRAAGVPARWQSGWETRPGLWNMHDWSEIYIEPWGWLPADASYGVQKKSNDPNVRDFFCGHMDPYRMIVNLDYSQQFHPPKSSYRSEPTDFQRGEVEIDGHNLYFDEWDYKFEFKTTPPEENDE